MNQCLALILFILQPSKQLFSAQIKKYYQKAQQCICNYTTSIFDTNVKQRQQSMKI